MNWKKILIFVGILIVVIIVIDQVKKASARRDLAAAKVAFDNENTNGAGLIGWIKGIADKVKGNDADTSIGNYTEDEAKSIAKDIADLYETGQPDDNEQADAMVTDLNNKGWSFTGYGTVMPYV